MAGVAIENRLFRIPPSAKDTTFIDACAAFLTPKMNLSQVMPSGCNLRRVAIEPTNQIVEPERPSASTYSENPTSSGRHTNTSTGCLLHPTPARWWWRCGGLNPCEHGNSRVNPPSGPIACGATTRGPSFSNRVRDAPEAIRDDAPDPHWHARPASSTPAVGGGHARTGRNIETVIVLYIFEQ